MTYSSSCERQSPRRHDDLEEPCLPVGDIGSGVEFAPCGSWRVQIENPARFVVSTGFVAGESRPRKWLGSFRPNAGDGRAPGDSGKPRRQSSTLAAISVLTHLAEARGTRKRMSASSSQGAPWKDRTANRQLRPAMTPPEERSRSPPKRLTFGGKALPVGKVTFGYDFGFFGWQPRPLSARAIR